MRDHTEETAAGCPVKNEKVNVTTVRLAAIKKDLTVQDVRLKKALLSQVSRKRWAHQSI
jgi:hypothetical protein